MRDGNGGHRVYPGWPIVLSLALMLAITSGARFLFGVVLKPISEEFGWSRTELATAVTINVILLTCLQPLVGVVVDRWGSRPVLLLGVVGTGLLAIPITMATHLWQIYLFYSVIAALAFAATSPVNTTKLVAGWFTHRRGLAMAIATSGGPIGQLLVIPAATLVMGAYGWRVSYWSLAGVAVLAMLPLGLWLVRDAPPGMSDPPAEAAAAEDAALSDALPSGGGPVGRPAPQTGSVVDHGHDVHGHAHSHALRSSAPTPEPEAIPLRRALTSSAFWYLAAGFSYCGLSMSFVQVHMVPYILDMPDHVGMAPQAVASAALAVVGGASIAGSLLIGYLADRFGHKSLLVTTYFLRGMAFVILLLAGTSSPGIFLAAVVLGVSWTSTTPLTAAISADIYGRAALGTIFGVLFSSMNLGSAVGVYLAGLDYDLTGNYHLVLVVNGFLGFGVAAVVQAVRVRPLRALPHPAATAPVRTAGAVAAVAEHD